MEMNESKRTLVVKITFKCKCCVHLDWMGEGEEFLDK